MEPWPVTNPASAGYIYLVNVVGYSPSDIIFCGVCRWESYMGLGLLSYGEGKNGERQGAWTSWIRVLLLVLTP